MKESSVFFKIIVPNYNNEQWLDKCLSSILRQSFKDYKVVVIDDMSTDSSVDIIKKYPFELVELDKKRYNGGARNVGIDYPIESKYTLFLDSDDWFYTNDVLKKLYFFLKERPVDCVSLPYHIVYPNFEEDFPLLRNTIRDLVFDPCGACWTKCIKSNLVRKFPENTLMEDTVQHIDQCNYLQTLDSVPFSVVCYNRTNVNALTSLEGSKGIKWQVSVLRYLADLMELWCPNADCEERRQERIEVTKKQIVEGRYFKW